ncbi:hypothetical protein HMPREF1870_00352 [Bacteroidales bacterium KA00344]|nr:hypothetical protein HMPREF1870_00352 [Bacteroidales bacterium KA00344]
MIFLGFVGAVLWHEGVLVKLNQQFFESVFMHAENKDGEGGVSFCCMPLRDYGLVDFFL